MFALFRRIVNFLEGLFVRALNAYRERRFYSRLRRMGIARRKKMTPEEIAKEDAESALSMCVWDADAQRKKLESEIEADLKRLDLRGHSVKRPEIGDFSYWLGIDPESIAAFKQAVDSGKPLETPIMLRPGYGRGCGECGEDVVYRTDGIKVEATTGCLFPDGVPLKFELNVPSGVMRVANDLRPAFRILGDYDICTSRGCAKTSHAMADIGCAYAYVGNSCPGFYRVGPNEFVIASSGSIETEDGDDLEVLPFGDLQAGITTDLWWYSIVDGDEYERRGVGADRAAKVEVRPGVYTFEHFAHLKSFDDSSEKPVIFTRVTWTREPDPVRDYKSEWLARNFTAGQVIAASMRNYPSLYNGPDAARSVANHIFCVIGGGGDWHENGFVQYDPDMRPGDPEVDIPAFDAAYRWYPMCEYSGLVKAAKGQIRLNPSFVALARNIIDCILKHGSIDFTDRPPSLRMRIRDFIRRLLGTTPEPENVRIARECKFALDARYPPAA